MGKHEITKIRMETVRRRLRVALKESITPRMLRIVFESGELAGFDSPSPDDHIKIFLPATAEREAAMRDFTPRAWDTEAGTLTLEFALHAHGPATEWARACRPGDVVEIGGPRGSAVVPDDFDWYLLIGDAAALPSIARRVESLRAGVPVSIVAVVAGEEERQTFAGTACWKARWLVSRGSAEEDAADLRSAVEAMPLPEGDGYIWIATEEAAARELYEDVVTRRKHPKEWVKAAGYWHASMEVVGPLG